MPSSMSAEARVGHGCIYNLQDQSNFIGLHGGRRISLRRADENGLSGGRQSRDSITSIPHPISGRVQVGKHGEPHQ
jgi:hypothetical protein